MPRNIVYRIIYEFCENVVYVSEHEKTRNDGTSRSCKITTSIIIKHTRHDGTSRSCKITTSIIIKHTRHDGTSRSCKITTSIIIKHTRHDGTSRSCKITTSIIIKHITQKETLKLQGFLNIYSIQPYMLKR
jgi:hypothetical protein